MFWKPDDEAKLIEADADDRKRIQAAQQRLEKLQPKFNEGMRECLMNQAMLNSYGQVDVTHNELEAKFMDNFQREQLANFARLNELTAPILAEIESVKRRIFKRNSIIFGSIESWSNAVLGKLPKEHPEAAGLQEAWAALKGSPTKALAEVLASWKPLVDRLEADEEIDVPILKFSRLAKQALEASS
jgi:hypothetical protein